jgi:hypothetical protein
MNKEDYKLGLFFWDYHGTTNGRWDL